VKTGEDGQGMLRQQLLSQAQQLELVLLLILVWIMTELSKIRQQVMMLGHRQMI